MPKYQPKPKPAPLVTSVSTQLNTQLKKSTVVSDTQVVTPEQIKEKKQKLMDVIETATEQFIDNLKNKKVDLSSSLDLERLVKLTLLLSGEADSITGKSINQKELETTVGTPAAEVSMSKIEEILSLDDPEVKSMFDRLYNGYNEINNQADNK